MGELCLQVLEELSDRYISKSQTIETDIPQDLPLVYADPARIRQAIINLLDNAIKYTPDGGAVTLMAALLDQQIQVAIQDNGYGIPSDELPYLFERFRRVKGVEGKIDGTGLGLAITKALVEQHGGQITVATKVGAGSTFTVFLPLT